MSNIIPQFSANPLEDFDIEITRTSDQGKFRVRVKGSGESVAIEMIALPTHLSVQESWQMEWRSSLSRTDSQSRHLRWYEEDAVVGSIKELGQHIFKAVFVGKILSLYDSKLQSARQAGKNLRVKLHVEPPELAVLPWEFLYDVHRNDYLFLQGISLVRIVDVDAPIPPLTVKRPLRILGMAVAPHDLPPLGIELEQKEIERALSDLRINSSIDWVWIPGTRDKLDEAMTKGAWHAFHFIGHGSFSKDDNTGMLALSSEDGKVDWLTAAELARILVKQQSLRAIVLNACEGAMGSTQDLFSSMAVTLMKQNIPAVLAMQYRISDNAAIEFARNFYKALAERQSLAAAVATSRRKMAKGKSIEWGIPVLYMRGSDEPFFTFTESAAESVDSSSQNITDPLVAATPKHSSNWRKFLLLLTGLLLGSAVLVGVVLKQQSFSTLLPSSSFASLIKINDQGAVAPADGFISFDAQQGKSVRIKIIVHNGTESTSHYRWSFIPSDPVNISALDNTTDTIDYIVPSKHRGQLIRVEVESSSYRETILIQAVINESVTD